jgi:hypothetical protein
VQQHAQNALHLEWQMRQRVLDDLQWTAQRKRTKHQLEVVVVVYEITPTAAPLCTGLRRPFFTVQLFESKARAVPQTGETFIRTATRAFDIPTT